MKSKLFQDPLPSQSLSNCSFSQIEKSSAKTAYRTDSVPGYGDPGGGRDAAPGAADKPQPSLTENRKVAEMKRSQQHYGPSGTSTSSQAAANTCPQGNRSPFAAGEQMHYQGSSHQSLLPPQLASPSHPDTDSALEAAVNSILEC